MNRQTNANEVSPSYFRRILVEQKNRIIAQARHSVGQDLSISADDLPDETDLAALEISHNLTFRLRDRERKLLKKIEQALLRINDGSFNECEDCGASIGQRRLEVQPFSTLCISCKEEQEHREKVYA